MSERVTFVGGSADGTDGIIGGPPQRIILAANGGVEGVSDDGEVIYSYDRYERTGQQIRGHRVYRFVPPKETGNA